MFVLVILLTYISYKHKSKTSIYTLFVYKGSDTCTHTHTHSATYKPKSHRNAHSHILTAFILHKMIDGNTPEFERISRGKVPIMKPRYVWPFDYRCARSDIKQTADHVSRSVNHSICNRLVAVKLRRWLRATQTVSRHTLWRVTDFITGCTRSCIDFPWEIHPETTWTTNIHLSMSAVILVFWWWWKPWKLNDSEQMPCWRYSVKCISSSSVSSRLTDFQH